VVGIAVLRRWLAGSVAPPCIALVGSLLVLTAVGPHWAFDDYVLALIAREEPELVGLRQGTFDLFTFTTGVPRDNRALMSAGVMLPWWTDESLQIAFFRPLSSLFHRFDYALWPASPRLAYLHGVFWLALVLLAVSALYRRIEGSKAIAALAGLVFAFDDAHAPVVAWASNRNALIATLFGVLALLAHDRGRREGHRPSAVLGPVCCLLSLSAGEFGIATFAYLVSHACFLDRAAPSARLRGLLPYGLVLAIWSGVYAWSGAGVRASGSYVSPLDEPLRFSRLFPERATGLLGAAFGFVPSDFLFMAPPRHAVAWLGVSLAVLVIVAWLLRPVLRADRLARFWLGGAFLATVPITASFPSDRLLLFVGVGVAPLVARVIEPLFRSAPASWRSVSLVRGAFALMHLLWAPLLVPVRAAQMQVTAGAIESATRSISELPDLARRTVVLVNTPVDVFASYLQAQLAWKRAPRPRHLYWLTSAGTGLRVERTDSTGLAVERDQGFLSTPLERHYRGDGASLKTGHTTELAGMSARIESSTTDGRPARVAFRFREPLESSSYVFLAWKNDRFEPFALPRPGETATFPAVELGALLVRAALRAR
jgi:hypothetical protein